MGRRSVFAGHSISMTSLYCVQARIQQGRSAIQEIIELTQVKKSSVGEGKTGGTLRTFRSSFWSKTQAKWIIRFFSDLYESSGHHVILHQERAIQARFSLAIMLTREEIIGPTIGYGKCERQTEFTGIPFS